MFDDSATTTEPAARRAVPGVALAGDATLLVEALRRLLEATCEVRPRAISKPKDLAAFDPRSAASKGASTAVVVLVDPIELTWRDAAQELRGRERAAGLVVITTRPTYAIQRAWRKPLDDTGGYVTNALLSSRADDEVLLKAIDLACGSPSSNTGLWLDDAGAAGAKEWLVPPHPRRWYATEEGRLAADLARDVGSYKALLCEASGLRRPEAATLLGIKEGQVKERLNKARDHLGAPNEVALGCRAVQLGLLEDPPESVRELFEELASGTGHHRVA